MISRLRLRATNQTETMWVVVNILVPFWGTLSIRCRMRIGTHKGTNTFDNHPSVGCRDGQGGFRVPSEPELLWAIER